LTQIFDTLCKRWFKVIKIYGATKLGTVLVNFLKVMTVFRFYANEALSHALTRLSQGESSQSRKTSKRADEREIAAGVQM